MSRKMRFLGAPAAIALVRIADSNLFFLTNLRDNALVHAESPARRGQAARGDDEP